MPSNPLTDPNWAPDLAGKITKVVGDVRDKTTNNAVKVVRGVVFGLICLFLGLVAVVLLLIIATRALQSALDIVVTWERAVYLSYFAIGGVLTLGGLLMMNKRAAK